MKNVRGRMLWFMHLSFVVGVDNIIEKYVAEYARRREVIWGGGKYREKSICRREESDG